MPAGTSRPTPGAQSCAGVSAVPCGSSPRGRVPAIGRSSAGVDFASLDGQPVHIVFLIVSPLDQPDEHLRAMDLIFRHLQQERFRKFLRQLDTTERIYDVLKEADEKTLVA